MDLLGLLRVECKTWTLAVNLYLASSASEQLEPCVESHGLGSCIPDAAKSCPTSLTDDRALGPAPGSRLSSKDVKHWLGYLTLSSWVEQIEDRAEFVG